MKKQEKFLTWNNMLGIAWIVCTGSLISIIYIFAPNPPPQEDFPSYPPIMDGEWERLGVDPPPSTFSPRQVIRYWGENVEKTLSLKDLYFKEFDTIMEAAEANDCTEPELLSILFAIRTAENGREGIEFGVLHPRAIDQPNSLRVQAGWCAATISKNHKRWLDSKEDVDFIAFLGNRYCPVGADNDPNGLNKHWIPNVRTLAERNLDAMYK